MKKAIAVILTLIAALSLAGCGTPEISHPYTQEYIAGQGNIQGDVNVESFLAASEDFAIGADENGKAVFKDPIKALDTLKELYAPELKRVQEHNGLGSLTYSNYPSYALATMEPEGTLNEEDLERILFVGSFFDIYENSFE